MDKIISLIVCKWVWMSLKFLISVWWTWDVLCWGDRLTSGFADVLRQEHWKLIQSSWKLAEFFDPLSVSIDFSMRTERTSSVKYKLAIFWSKFRDSYYEQSAKASFNYGNWIKAQKKHLHIWHSNWLLASSSQNRLYTSSLPWIKRT